MQTRTSRNSGTKGRSKNTRTQALSKRKGSDTISEGTGRSTRGPKQKAPAVRAEREQAPGAVRRPRPAKASPIGERRPSSRDRGNAKPEFVENPNLIIGRNPVLEAVKSGRTIDKLLIQKDAEGSIGKIISLAREKGLQIQYVDRIVLDKLSPGRPHQGAAAFAAAHAYADLDDILKAAEEKGGPPLIVILDGLEDPHNLGAIMRSADGAGAHGVIIPARRAVGLTEVVAKASAGAIEYVPVAKVTNLAQTVDRLKEKGLWVAAVDMDGTPYSKATLKGPLAFIIGGEGSGVSRLLKEKADFVISIPMKGRINSLNASNAAAIMLYEAARQRDEDSE